MSKFLRRASTVLLMTGALVAPMAASPQALTHERVLATTRTAPGDAPVNRDGGCCGWTGPDRK